MRSTTRRRGWNTPARVGVPVEPPAVVRRSPRGRTPRGAQPAVGRRSARGPQARGERAAEPAPWASPSTESQAIGPTRDAAATPSRAARRRPSRHRLRAERGQVDAVCLDPVGAAARERVPVEHRHRRRARRRLEDRLVHRQVALPLGAERRPEHALDAGLAEGGERLLDVQRVAALVVVVADHHDHDAAKLAPERRRPLDHVGGPLAVVGAARGRRAAGRRPPRAAGRRPGRGSASPRGRRRSPSRPSRRRP